MKICCIEISCNLRAHWRLMLNNSAEYFIFALFSPVLHYTFYYASGPYKWLFIIAKLKLHNNPQMPQRTTSKSTQSLGPHHSLDIVWKVQDSTNSRWIGKVFDKLLLKPCLQRGLLNISVDWKYFQSVVLKTRLMILFRVNNSENLGSKDTGRNKQIILSWFFDILCFGQHFKLILISSWIGVWIIHCWHWTLRVNHEEPCEDQSWQFRHQHNSQHPHARESVTMWWIVTHSSWHVTTPVTWDDHSHSALRAVLSGMRNEGRNDDGPQ